MRCCICNKVDGFMTLHNKMICMACYNAFPSSNIGKHMNIECREWISKHQLAFSQENYIKAYYAIVQSKEYDGIYTNPSEESC